MVGAPMNETSASIDRDTVNVYRTSPCEIKVSFAVAFCLPLNPPPFNVACVSKRTIEKSFHVDGALRLSTLIGGVRGGVGKTYFNFAG